jgi:hypothetical protein
MGATYSSPFFSSTGVMLLFRASLVFTLILMNFSLLNAQNDTELPDPSLFLVNESIKSQPVKEQNLNPEMSERDLWIRNSLDDLHMYTPEKCLNPIEPAAFELGDDYHMSFRLRGKEGCIVFPGKNWIYLISHSIYEDPYVGDITLAIDNKGEIFFNEGHVCGGTIRFYHRSQSRLDLTESAQFFELFASDTDNAAWIPFTNE